MKKILAIFLTLALGFTMMALPASAQTYIVPETVINDSTADLINIINNIHSWQISGEGNYEGADTIINPTTYVEGVDTTILNIFNTIVNVQIDSSELANSFGDIREKIFSKYGISE